MKAQEICTKVLMKTPKTDTAVADLGINGG
jgi:hypothetical protein